MTVRTEARAEAAVAEEPEVLVGASVGLLTAADSPAPELLLAPGRDEAGNG